MNSVYMKSGNMFRVASKEVLDQYEELPATTYVVRADMEGNIFLEKIEKFNIGHKLYGNVNKHTQRILKTFLDRDVSTGVLLNGEKGSGKSLLAKNIAVQAEKLGIPTLVVNSPFAGDRFNGFIQKITQPCVVLFDEFEKVYDEEEQEAILTLLDGVYPSKKLFVLTCNDRDRVNDNMKNRPGRIFYLLDFIGIDLNFVKEYCEDNLIDKTQSDKVVQIVTIFDKFNFDMLKALIEEMNRFAETASEAIRMLNAKPEFGGKSSYDCELFVDNKKIPKKKLHNNGSVYLNPLFEPFKVHYQKSRGGLESILFKPSDIKSIDMDGTIVLIDSKGIKLSLRRLCLKETSYIDTLDQEIDD
jgi:hypothetical protein